MWLRSHPDGHQDIPGYVTEAQTIPVISDLPMLEELDLNRFDLTPVQSGDFEELSMDLNDSRDVPSLERYAQTTVDNFLRKLPSSLRVLGINMVTRSVVPMFGRLPGLVKDGTLPNLKCLEFLRAETKCAEIVKACEGSDVEVFFPSYWGE